MRGDGYYSRGGGGGSGGQRRGNPHHNHHHNKGDAGHGNDDRDHKEKKKRDAFFDLKKYSDKRIHVKFMGGREVAGILKGFDQLLNIVLDDAEEITHGPEDQESGASAEEKRRHIGLVVLRGPSIILLSPTDGSEEIANPQLDLALLSKAVYDFAGEPTDIGLKVASALRVIEAALYRYGPSHVALSFNGGKDCTILMHLIRAALHKYNVEYDLSSKPLVSIYVMYKKTFSEIDDFVDQSVGRYDLDLIKVNGPMKQGLQSFKDSYPETKAIFVGTRGDDPHGKKLEYFSKTDADWPEFMRVNPVLDWTFEDIWGSIRGMGVRYCCLYDQGYTSLGDVDSTKRNPALLKDGCYQPAWSLVDRCLERSGRSSTSTDEDPLLSVLPLPASGNANCSTNGSRSVEPPEKE
ncbi:3'-phosphoadenosine 5'-phosphosulfate sulfotransferase [Coemansia sp. RSA 1646]|nr:3'-phosphoadenosine 5'-phosphosulfate sulfotransferase [Coemansia sp. RSA 1646]